MKCLIHFHRISLFAASLGILLARESIHSFQCAKQERAENPRRRIQVASSPLSPLQNNKSNRSEEQQPCAEIHRRIMILSSASTFVVSLFSQPALSAESTVPSATISPDDAKITQKVFMNVRVSRQDGTFYVRDDLPDIPENRVFQGRLVIGLFGKNAPNHVDRFLSYIDTNFDPLDDNPLPSYGRASFPSFDQANGLLMVGKIPSLEYTEFQGNPTLRYIGRLLPASLWVERDRSLPRVSHTAKGLLTHRQLDVMPDFGITTRADSTPLDRSNTVFGRILFDESSEEFLRLVQDLPTYSIDRPSSMMDPTKESAVDEAAQAVFNAQRQFFRKAASSIGDTRVGKVYDGKLLRRVEVTQVGML